MYFIATENHGVEPLIFNTLESAKSEANRLGKFVAYQQTEFKIYFITSGTLMKNAQEMTF